MGKMEWILVLKRKPRIGDLVICLGYDTQGEVFIASRQVLTPAQAKRFCEVAEEDLVIVDKWYWNTNPNSAIHDGCRYDRVTHWCPIPAIPRDYARDKFVI